MNPPVIEKICSKRKFGFVNDEFRGNDLSKLINPPIELNDNYNWIRDDSRKSEKVLSHIKKENEYTNYIMNPHKELIKTLYKESRSYIQESYETYAYHINNRDNWKYFRRFKEGEEYPSHWRKKELKDGCVIEEELLNENKLAEGKKQCDVSSFDISPSHKYISYGVDYDGSEKYEFVITNLNSRTNLSHTIPKIAYCSYFWAGDSMIYYFVGDESNRIYQLWMFDIKNCMSQLIYEEQNPDYNLSGELSADEEYIILCSGNYDTNICKYINWKLNPFKIYDFLHVIPKVKYGIEHHKGSWYIITNKDAINWKILKLKPKIKPEWNNLVEFIPPNDYINISSLCVFEKFFTFKTKINGCIYLNIIDHEKNYIKILTHIENKSMTWDEYLNLDFKSMRSENIYSIGLGINSIYSTTKINIIFSSMIHTTQLFEYDIETLGYTKVHEQIVPNYNQELYTSKRIWINQEGTRLGIPVSIVYRKDMFRNNKTNPLYLYGYGSYGITVNPGFNSKLLPLLDRGYIYAIAHIRGGSFLGYDWYEDGRMDKKINTFNDFIRCAEYFQESGMIDPNKIVIEGRSAGGLLIGACLTMRPDLFWIGIPGVPFVDVLNTMSDSTIPLTKEEWTQWGNPNEKESFEIISKYCPYYNVKSNSYPHMYCTAGLHDPRVPYWEILKLLAKIREYKKDSNIQIARIETSQGHFGGSSRYKSIEELAEKYAFIFTR